MTARRPSPPKDSGLKWRVAAKEWRCGGNGAGKNTRHAAGCARTIRKGEVHLECLWEALPFHSGSRHSRACARDFFGEYL